MRDIIRSKGTYIYAPYGSSFTEFVPHALASRWDPVDVVVVGGSPFLLVSVKGDRY